MTSLYRVTPGSTPCASDISQVVDALGGANDIGQITLAAPISAPSNAGITGAAQTGTTLGTGTYRYQFTYVVGYKKTDSGQTVVLGGETLPSASVSVTTTTGNQSVKLSGLPTTWPSTAVALRIYRTAVGGADGTQKLVTTITTAVATYTDTTADGALTTAVPTVNTTGTNIVLNGSFTGPYSSNGELTGVLTDLNGNTFAVSIAAPAATGVDPFGIMTGGGASAVKAFSVSKTNVVASKNNTFDDGAGGASIKGALTITTNNTALWGKTTVGASRTMAWIGNDNGTYYGDNANVATTVLMGGAVTTSKGGNTLDNGSGAATFAGALTVNSSASGLMIGTNGDITQRGTVMAPTRVSGGLMQYWNGSGWQTVAGYGRTNKGTATTTSTTAATILSLSGMGRLVQFYVGTVPSGTFFIDSIVVDGVTIVSGLSTGTGISMVAPANGGYILMQPAVNTIFETDICFESSLVVNVHSTTGASVQCNWIYELV